MGKAKGKTGASRKAGPGKKGKPRKKAPGRKLAVKASLGDGRWCTAKECVAKLAGDGFRLSQKNLYAHYGPSSQHPVQRDKRGRWDYAELVERVRLNSDKGGADPITVNKVSLARQLAELKIKQEDARLKEMRRKKAEGELIEVAAVKTVMTQARVAMETDRKRFVADLVNMLTMKSEKEVYAVLERESRRWLGGMAEAFERLRVGG